MLTLDSSQPMPGSSLSGNHQACWAATTRGSIPLKSLARWRTFPRGDSITTQSPSSIPSFFAVSGWISTTGSGWSPLSQGIWRPSEWKSPGILAPVMRM